MMFDACIARQPRPEGKRGTTGTALFPKKRKGKPKY